jgi:membrane fusion protein (multidrug efflux system)
MKNEHSKLENAAEKLKKLYFRETPSGQRQINKKVAYWTAVSAAVFLTFFFGYIYTGGEKPVVEKRVAVELDEVRTGSIEETMELTGWIRAEKIADIRSKVAGRIESLQLSTNSGATVAVEEGLVVKKGQQIAVIDHDVYLAQLEAARADVEAQRVELADAEREEKRMVGLYEGGSATEQEKDKAVTAAKLATARLALAKANLELAEVNLRESRIVSPIDGIITARHIDEGNLINTGDRIVTVAKLDTVKVVVAAAERYSSAVHVGTPVRIRVDAFGGKVFETKVYSVYPALEERTHTVQIEVRINNDELLLKPGMFARVTLITQRKDNVVVVPRDVVLGGKVDEPYVYVVEDDVASKRLVKMGIIQGDMCEITEGLRAGERLVVNGMNYLTEGTAVDVVRIEDIK